MKAKTIAGRIHEAAAAQLKHRPACKACHRELGIPVREFAREFVKYLADGSKVLGDVTLSKDQIYVMNPVMVAELLKTCARYKISYKAFQLGETPKVKGATITMED